MTLLFTMDRMTITIPPLEWWRALSTWFYDVIAVMSGQQDIADGEKADAKSSRELSLTITPLDPQDMQRFKETILPLLDSAYSFARYLIRDDIGAEDVVQEVYLRALKAYPQHRGGDARSWLLAIVRNCCMTWIAKNVRHEERVVDNQDALNDVAASNDQGYVTPEQEYDTQQRTRLVRELIQTLSEPLREVLILREIEDMSYGQIAGIMKIPVGTVMSRLARARSQLFATCQQRGLVVP